MSAEIAAFAAAMLPMLQAGIKADLKEVVEHMDKTMDETMGEVKKTLVVHEERIDGHDVKLNGIEGRVDALEKARVKASSESGSGSSGSGFSAGDFVAKNLEIKNVCEYERKKEEGVTREEAGRGMNTVKNRMPPSMSMELGEISVFAFKNHKFHVAVGNTKRLQELRGCIDEILATGEFNINFRTQKVGIERSPLERERYRLFAENCNATRAMVASLLQAECVVNALSCETATKQTAGTATTSTWISEVERHTNTVRINDTALTDLGGLSRDEFLRGGRNRASR